MALWPIGDKPALALRTDVRWTSFCVHCRGHCVLLMGCGASCGGKKLKEIHPEPRPAPTTKKLPETAENEFAGLFGVRLPAFARVLSTRTNIMRCRLKES